MSNAFAPWRIVASKNGERRYHGPKYKVVETGSLIRVHLLGQVRTNEIEPLFKLPTQRGGRRVVSFGRVDDSGRARFLRCTSRGPTDRLGTCSNGEPDFSAIE